MSRDSTKVAADDDITKLEGSSEYSPPLKKPKTDPKAEAEEEVDALAEAVFPPQEIHVFRKRIKDDPDYLKQRDLFTQQYEQSQGYEVDWDKLDYDFAPVKFEWGGEFDDKLSNDDLMRLLLKTAIDKENDEYGTQLKFVKYVSANVTGVQGFLFHITFWAQDLSSEYPEPELYQTKVLKFGPEIDVIQFRLRPTPEDEDED